MALIRKQHDTGDRMRNTHTRYNREEEPSEQTGMINDVKQGNRG